MSRRRRRSDPRGHDPDLNLSTPLASRDHVDPPVGVVVVVNVRIGGVNSVSAVATLSQQDAGLFKGKGRLAGSELTDVVGCANISRATDVPQELELLEKIV